MKYKFTLEARKGPIFICPGCYTQNTTTILADDSRSESVVGFFCDTCTQEHAVTESVRVLLPPAARKKRGQLILL